MTLSFRVPAALLLALACACAGPKTRPERIGLGVVVDVLAGEAIPLEEVVAGWPASFLVGDGGAAAAATDARADLHARYPESPVVTVVDASGLDALQLPAVQATLVEAALEDGGPIVVDGGDGVARRLSGVARRPALVRVSATGEVLARLALDGASEEDLSAALGLR